MTLHFVVSINYKEPTKAGCSPAALEYFSLSPIHSFICSLSPFLCLFLSIQGCVKLTHYTQTKRLFRLNSLTQKWISLATIILDLASQMVIFNKNKMHKKEKNWQFQACVYKNGSIGANSINNKSIFVSMGESVFAESKLVVGGRSLSLIH